MENDDLNFSFLNPDDANNSNGEEIPMDVWVPDRALEAINMERAMNPDITEIALANKILKDNLPVIAVGITHTAKYSPDARLRQQAQIYVMDRVMGKVGNNVVTEDSPIDALNNELLKLVGAALDEEVAVSSAGNESNEG